jgi:hypothetical protein
MTGRFCKDCRWFTPLEMVRGTGECGHPELMTEPNPVTGKRLKVDAYNERKNHGSVLEWLFGFSLSRCGPRGSLFEARDQENER